MKVGKKTIFIFICLTLTLLYSGCNSKKTKEIEIITGKLNNIFSVSPQQKIADEENLGAHIEALIYENLYYTVIEVTDSSYTVTIQAPNMILLFDELYDETQYLNLSASEYAVATEQLLSNIEKRLINKQFEVKETILTLPLENGEIMITEELINALYGGLIDVARELTENYLENAS